MQRRLAAIIHADVVGYSRLMEGQETFTLRRLKTLRKQLWDPIILANKGRVVNTAGDSLLIEFASVHSAMRCAVELQKGTRAHNADQEDARKMLLRIGVNLGEVIYDEEDDDLYGDGVNMAARIQALSTPGGIAVSGKVHDEVMGKIPVEFVDAGEHQVKNIARPVRIWRAVMEGDPAVLRQQPVKPVDLEVLEPVRRADDAAAGAGGARTTMATQPSRAAGWWLRGRDREGKDYEVFIDAQKAKGKDGLVLGRHPQQAQLVVPHPSLSRLHCRFKLDGDTLTVGDLELLNGTIVDGRKLDKGESTVLKAGSRLNLGEVTLSLGEAASGRG